MIQMADGTVIIDTKLDKIGAQSDIQSLDGALDKSFVAAGVSLAALTAAAVTLGTQIYQLGTAFGTSFAKASTMMIGTGVDVDALKDNVLDLSDAANIAADELNEGLYQALSAGVSITNDGADALGFMEENTKLAKAGFSDLTTTVDTTTSIINAYGLAQDDVNEIADTLINTQNEGKTTVAELGAVMGQVIPTAASLGVELDQVGATFAAMTAQGIPTAQAATQIRQAMVELSKSGTTASDAFKEVAGVSFQEFITAGGTMQQAMAMLKQKSDASGVSISDLFSSVEAANVALVLASDTGAVKFNKSLTTINTNAGATDAAFDIVSNTVGYKMEQSFNKLKNAGIKTFDALAPGIETVADVLGGLADVLQDIPEPVIKFGVAFGAAFIASRAAKVVMGVVASFKTLTTAVVGTTAATESAAIAQAAFNKTAQTKTILDQYGNALSTVKVATTAQTVATQGATVAQTGLNAAMAANVIGIVVLAVTALITVYQSWKEHQDELAEKSKEYFQDYLNDRLTSINAEKAALAEQSTGVETYKSKLDELNGTNVSTVVNAEISGALDSLEDVKGIMFDIAAGGEIAQEAIDAATESINNWVAAQKEAKNQQFADELLRIADAFRQGALSQEDAAAAYDDVIGRSKTYNENITNVADTLTSVIKGGEDGKMTFDEFAASMSAVESTGVTLVEANGTLAESFAALQEAYANGEGEAAMNSRMQELAEFISNDFVASANGATDALAQYEESMRLADETAQVSIDVGPDYLAAIEERRNAVWGMSEEVYRLGNNEAAAAEVTKNASADTLAAIKADMLDRLGTEDITFANLVALRETYDSDITTQEQQLNDDIAAIQSGRYEKMTADEKQAAIDKGGIFAEYVSDRLTAEQGLSDQLLEISGSFTEDQYNEMADWAKNSGVNLSDYGIESYNSFKKSTKTWGEALSTGQGQNNKELLAKVREFIPQYQTYATEMEAAAKKSGEGIGDKNAEGIDSKDTLVSETSKDMGTKATDNLADSEQSYSQGADFGQGYVNGIWDKVQAAADAATALANAAVSKVPITQKSKSPSKLTHGFGLNFGEGYEKGIADKIPDIEKAAQELANAALSESARLSTNLESTQVFKSVLGKPQYITNTTNNDKGVQQTIIIQQPVKTPSETARAIKREAVALVNG